MLDRVHHVPVESTYETPSPSRRLPSCSTELGRNSAFAPAPDPLGRASSEQPWVSCRPTECYRFIYRRRDRSSIHGPWQLALGSWRLCVCLLVVIVHCCCLTGNCPGLLNASCGRLLEHSPLVLEITLQTMVP